MKPSEVCSQNLLVRFLEDRGHTVVTKPGDNPPDWLFTVDGNRWAVEVTELHQYLDGPVAERLGIEEQLDRFGRKLDEQTRMFRRYSYLLYLAGPICRDEEQLIEAQVAAYLDAGCTTPLYLGYNVPSEEDIGIDLGPRPDDVGRSCIQAIGPNSLSDDLRRLLEDCGLEMPDTPGNILRVGIGLKMKVPLLGGKRNCDIQTSIGESLQRILTSKKPKMAKLIGYNSRVLIIFSQNPLAEPEFVRPVVQPLLQAGYPIEALFYIHSGEVCQMYPSLTD